MSRDLEETLYKCSNDYVSMYDMYAGAEAKLWVNTFRIITESPSLNLFDRDDTRRAECTQWC